MKTTIDIWKAAFASLALATAACAQAAPAARPASAEYAKLQERVCRGWNTWANKSMTSHVWLPGGATFNFGFTDAGHGECVRELRKTSGRQRNGIMPGFRAIDGAYTSATALFKNRPVKIETATDGDDLLVLLSPERPEGFLAVADASISWNLEGCAGRAGEKLFCEAAGRRFELSCTAKHVPMENNHKLASLPRLCAKLDGKVGFHTGRARTLAEIEKAVAAAREAQEKRIAAFGAKAEAAKVVQTTLGWSLIYEATGKRAISPVSRNWSMNNGWVLFDWDTYFAAWMYSSFDMDMAFANAIAITKAITAKGFIPNFCGDGFSSDDRSQPPVGGITVLELYRKSGKKWLLEETYDELASWNRWWPRARSCGDGYLGWGTDAKIGSVVGSGTLQGAKFESGLDNSPAFDLAKMDPETNTMDQSDVGLMGLYVADCKALAEMAKVLGRDADAKEFLARAEKYAAKIGTMWDEKTGMYLDVRYKAGGKVDVLTPCNFYPMIAGIPTQAQAERLMKEHYFNPAEFHGKYVIPASARNGRGYRDNSYWRGRIWGPMNFLVYLGMRNYDLPEARKDLIERSLALQLQNYNADGGVYENYNAENGRGSDVRNSDGFYHWGALLSYIGIMDGAR